MYRHGDRVRYRDSDATVLGPDSTPGHWRLDVHGTGLVVVAESDLADPAAAEPARTKPARKPKGSAPKVIPVQESHHG